MKSVIFIPRTHFRSVSILILIVLTVSFVYESQKKIDESGKSSSAFVQYMKTTFKLEDTLLELPVGKARHDNKRIYRIYDFHFTGRQWESLVNKYDICFATQTSIERIYWLPYILERWTGPLSIAIQLTSEEEWLIFNLFKIYLTKCHSAFGNQVAIHLAVPANLTALKIDYKLLSQWDELSLKNISQKSETCPEAKEYLKYLLHMLPTIDKRKLKYKEVYPQNHMRNIARKGCATHWTYTADVDIIPRDGMADMLQNFYNDQKLKGTLCAKCAYVIPTFELKSSFPFPEDKKQVFELFKTGAAQQYNLKVYEPAQAATNYKRWISTKLEEEDVTISHEVDKKKLKYFEPFYVSADNIEPYDERFLGYGFTRSSQFKAAFTAGWKFYVLTPVFSVHWGQQTSKTFEVPRKNGIGKAVRLDQNTRNRNFYKKFVRELEFKKSIGIM